MGRPDWRRTWTVRTAAVRLLTLQNAMAPHSLRNEFGSETISVAVVSHHDGIFHRRGGRMDR